MICDYCKGIRPNTDGWHDCEQAQAAKCQLQAAVSGIRTIMIKPSTQPITSNEMKIREDRREAMATGIKLNGGGVKPEYE